MAEVRFKSAAEMLLGGPDGEGELGHCGLVHSFSVLDLVGLAG